MAGEDPSEAMARVWANLDIFNRQLDRRDGPVSFNELEDSIKAHRLLITGGADTNSNSMAISCKESGRCMPI